MVAIFLDLSPKVKETKPKIKKCWASLGINAGDTTYPWSRKIPQLSPCATTTEAEYLESMLRNEKPLQLEAHTLQPESSPYSSQEKAHTQQWRPSAAKNKINKYFN